MVDTLDSGSSAGNGVEVRLLSRAPKQISPKGEFCFGQKGFIGFCYANTMEGTGKITIKAWHALVALTVIGAVVFWSGLSNPFIGDDLLQIVPSIPVHSIENIGLFFQGSTFYNGQGLAPLTGIYYRPMMVTAYSLVYSLFGPAPTAFHIL